MKTFLFVTWAGGGNQHPLVALGTRLAARGHRIRVLGPAGLLESFAAEGFERVLTAGPLPSADEVLRELARAPADALVVDYMATEALCGAERAGLPVAVLVHTLYRALLRDGELPTMAMAGSVERLNEVRRRLGLAPVDRLAALLDGATAVIVTSLPAIDAPGSDPLPDNVHYVGPLLEPPGPDAGWSPPWPMGDSRPLVTVCLGTTPMGEQEILQRVLEALGEVDARVLVTSGSHIDFDAFTVPNNVTMVRYVRHAVVLPAARLLVTHAGLGSVSAALTFGVPMVCMPLGREQPVNAARVAALGAGHVLLPTARPAEIAVAIGHVLGDPAYREAAGRVAAGIAAATAEDAAAVRLEAIARL